MPIEIKSVEYTSYGVNIIGTEYDEEVLTLADGTTRVLRTNERGYAAPCGINDGKDIEAHVAKVLGEAAAKPFTDVAILNAEKQKLEAELNAARSQLLQPTQLQDAESNTNAAQQAMRRFA